MQWPYFVLFILLVNIFFILLHHTHPEKKNQTSPENRTGRNRPWPFLLNLCFPEAAASDRSPYSFYWITASFPPARHCQPVLGSRQYYGITAPRPCWGPFPPWLCHLTGPGLPAALCRTCPLSRHRTCLRFLWGSFRLKVFALAALCAHPVGLLWALEKLAQALWKMPGAEGSFNGF